MCKALYSINVERNLQKVQEILYVILLTDTENGYPERIVNLSIDLNVDVVNLESYIERVSGGARYAFLFEANGFIISPRS